MELAEKYISQEPSKRDPGKHKDVTIENYLQHPKTASITSTEPASDFLAHSSSHLKEQQQTL